MKLIDAHIHICENLNGFGSRGELRCIGGGFVQYADGAASRCSLRNWEKRESVPKQ